MDEPALLNIREAPDVNPAWPHLVADGERLVAVWSIYHGTTADEMKGAVRVEWSSRPLTDPAGGARHKHSTCAKGERRAAA